MSSIDFYNWIILFDIIWMKNVFFKVCVKVVPYREKNRKMLTSSNDFFSRSVTIYFFSSTLHPTRGVKTWVGRVTGNRGIILFGRMLKLCYYVLRWLRFWMKVGVIKHISKRGLPNDQWQVCFKLASSFQRRNFFVTFVP